MKIITVANQKGGVGKTTSTLNFGVALAKKGKRVLLVDGDPQGNLTSYLGVTPGEAGDEGSPSYENLRTLDEIYLAKRPPNADEIQNFIAQTSSGVSLIASDSALTSVEHYLFSRPDREKVLSKFFESIQGQFDYVFIDTPPSLNLLTLNALCASDYVLIPMQTEFFSLEGIVKIQEAIENVQARWNEKLSIIGVLATQVNKRRKLTLEVLETLRESLGDLVFEAIIHDNASVAESSGHAKSVFDYDRKSQGSKDYSQAAQELLKRCESWSERLRGLVVQTLETTIEKTSSQEANP
jgi:chromosome partitioning protein